MPAGTNLEAIWGQNRCQDHFRCRTTLDDAQVYFSLVGNYLRPSNNSRALNFIINAVVLIVITCLDLRKW